MTERDALAEAAIAWAEARLCYEAAAKASQIGRSRSSRIGRAAKDALLDAVIRAGSKEVAARSAYLAQRGD